MDIDCNLSTSWHFLAKCLFYDKVMHIIGYLESLRITLSGIAYAIWCQTASTPHFDFHAAAMLDDRASCCRTAILGAISSLFSDRGWILQQFYLQWKVVYTSLNPAIQQGWPVVLSRYWILAGWQSDKYLNLSYYSQSSRNDRGEAWQKTLLPMSFSFSSSVPARETPASEAGTLIRLCCRRSIHSSHSASGHRKAELAAGSASSRDCGSDLGGVYSQSRVELRPVGQDDCAQQAHYRKCDANRRTFRSARFKKTTRAEAPKPGRR